MWPTDFKPLGISFDANLRLQVRCWWSTASRRFILVEDLADNHLLNIELLMRGAGADTRALRSDVAAVCRPTISNEVLRRSLIPKVGVYGRSGLIETGLGTFLETKWDPYDVDLFDAWAGLVGYDQVGINLAKAIRLAMLALPRRSRKRYTISLNGTERSDDIGGVTEPCTTT